MNYLKWLNLETMCRKFIDPKTQELQAIYNFTAYATHIPDAYQRHRTYIQALSQFNIHTVFGQFKQKQVWARCCQDTSVKISRDTYEEKESDVNMALYILNKAYRDDYDRAIIVTRDSDIVPACGFTFEVQQFLLN